MIMATLSTHSHRARHGRSVLHFFDDFSRFMMRNLLSQAAAVIATAGTLLLTGCAAMQSTGPVSIAIPAMQGKAFGGQQPVNGATIQLYAVGTTGYGSAATPLLTSTVKSAADGSFSLTSRYTCQTGSELYITATGGDPGGGTNPALAMMTALGRCETLTASTFIFINELTTVGSVWALAPFMSGSNVGAPPTNTQGLADAFSDVNQLVNTGSGTTPGPTLPSSAVVPVAQINTVADILAACVNSTGAGSGLGPCDILFRNTPSVGGVAPTDTIPRR